MIDQLLEFSQNHPLLVTGVIATWLAVMIYEIRLKSQGFTHVSATDAVRLINKGAVVVDVRNAEEYRAAHIVNAKNIQPSELEDPSLVTKYKNRVVVTVCNNGMTSNKAANQLRKAGVSQAFSLRGGLAGWRNDKLPLAK